MNRKIDQIIKKNKYRSKFYQQVKPRRTTKSITKPSVMRHDPNVKEQVNKEDNHYFNYKMFMRMVNRTLIAGVVLLIGLIMKKDDRFISFNHYFYSNMNLKKIDHYMITTYGRIFPVPNSDDLYVNLPIIDLNNSTTFKDGILVVTDYGEGVYSHAEGIVIRKYQDDDLGQVIEVQDVEGYIYQYGNLSDVKVKLYSRVSVGELIGMPLQNAELDGEYYLAVSNENEYLNVYEVIQDEN